ncbi:MAG: hypothetical protein NVV72_01280 [Asticcacaulis sp.]|nr:hypothetical protein [Asticcacaulis sp.]
MPEDLAEREAVFLQRGKSASDLEKEAQEREHNRTQRFRDHFETMAVVALWGMFVALGVVAIVWLWHIVSPAQIPIWTWATIHCHWLTDKQMDTMQNIITGGIIAASLGKHFEKRLNRG